MTQEEHYKRMELLDKLEGLKMMRDAYAAKLQATEASIHDGMSEHERMVAEARASNIREEIESLEAQIREIRGY